MTNQVRDARRFILYHKWVIENSPLQVYASALVFSPTRSLMREAYKQEEPEWITTKPIIEDHWNACLQMLEGHSDGVLSVTFSHDSKLLASASYDKTVRIWNAGTGSLQQTLEGHDSAVMSVTFFCIQSVSLTSAWQERWTIEQRMQTRNTSESDSVSCSRNVQKSKHRNFKNRNIHKLATCLFEYATEQDHATQLNQQLNTRNQISMQTNMHSFDES